MECSMHYRADVSEPDPSPIIISKYLSEPGPTRRVPTGSDGLGSGIYPLFPTHNPLPQGVQAVVTDILS